jgi:hypothetical protein
MEAIALATAYMMAVSCNHKQVQVRKQAQAERAIGSERQGNVSLLYRAAQHNTTDAVAEHSRACVSVSGVVVQRNVTQHVSTAYLSSDLEVVCRES